MTKDLHGLLVLDKPTGITSRDAVNRAQQWFPPRTRIGHTGTLDPLATGVLVFCIGNATRLAEYVQAMDKTYRTTLVLGARSDTDDADGTILPIDAATAVAESAVCAGIARLVGNIDQRPPAYSAIKIDGKRAHDLARRGDHVEIASRIVTIYAIDLVRYEWPELDLEVRCGKGTYIRSLARDLGECLGCGAYVKTLRRTRVGCFRTEDALPVDATASDAHARLLPSSTAVAHLPSIRLPDAKIALLRQGQTSPLVDADDVPLCSVVDLRDNLVAVGFIRDGCLRSLKNLK
jgi:tRNA pseudouridine55 synthase